jgi:hypothetical protein
MSRIHNTDYDGSGSASRACRWSASGGSGSFLIPGKCVFFSFPYNIHNIENNYSYPLSVYDVDAKDKAIWTGTAAM